MKAFSCRRLTLRTDLGLQFADEVPSSILLPVFHCELQQSPTIMARSAKWCTLMRPPLFHDSCMSCWEIHMFDADAPFKVLSIAKQAMFSLEPRVHFDDATRRLWSDTIHTDKAYLHSIVSVVGFYRGLASGRHARENRAPAYAFQHLAQALSLVRERVTSADDGLRTSDQTMMAIMVLAIQSYLLGHAETAMSHLKGVRRIVDLRGGVVALRSSPKLLLEMLRSVIPVMHATYQLAGAYIAPQKLGSIGIPRQNACGLRRTV